MAQKKKKRKLTPFGKFLKYCYRILMALSAVIVTLAVVWTVAIRPPEVAPPTPPVLGSDDPTTPGNEAEDPAAPTRKDRHYTFLLAAFDQVSGSTDTMMVASYDATTHRASVVSVPRDTLLDRRVGAYHYYKLNSAYSNGEAANGEGGGAQELKSVVSDLLGIPIDYYILVDLKSFVKIVDAVGGVDFEVPVYMDYDAPDQDLHIHYEPKMYHGLTGQQVMEIARCRKNTIWNDAGTDYELYDTYPDADIGRTRTQQDLLKAIAKKLVSWNSLPKVTQFIDIFNTSVDTNIPPDAMLFFASDALSGDALSTLSTATFPGDGEVTYQGKSYCYQYDIPASLELINTMLNPYVTPVTEDMVHMPQVK